MGDILHVVKTSWIWYDLCVISSDHIGVKKNTWLHLNNSNLKWYHLERNNVLYIEICYIYICVHCVGVYVYTLYIIVPSIELYLLHVYVYSVFIIEQTVVLLILLQQFVAVTAYGLCFIRNMTFEFYVLKSSCFKIQYN